MSFMGKLLSGTAPLRGRAGLELIIQPLDYRLASEFWEITDSRLAVLVHAITGGTPAYRREFVRSDSPANLDDFDDWVCRAVLSPAVPLFREARYLLAEEPGIRDSGLYHSVLAAVAEGNCTRGGIANYVGRRGADIGHPLNVLEDAGLLRREHDLLRHGRSAYRITEPLITFYYAVMRPDWSTLESSLLMPERTWAAWRAAGDRFNGNVMGPHFEELCRVWAARFADPSVFRDNADAPTVVDVGTTVIGDTPARTGHQVDVLVATPAYGERRRILSIGEAKWGATMGMRHYERLVRVRELMTARGDVDASGARPTCYSAAGFTDDLLRLAEAGRVLLIGLDELYGATGRS
jgi:hypothetical protein